MQNGGFDREYLIAGVIAEKWNISYRRVTQENKVNERIEDLFGQNIEKAFKQRCGIMNWGNSVYPIGKVLEQ